MNPLKIPRTIAAAMSLFAAVTVIVAPTVSANSPVCDIGGR